MYEELVAELRKMQSVEYCVIASTEDVHAIKIVDEAADAIEELQAAVEREKAFADCWEEMAQECKARFEKLQKQLQESEVDNVNLTGWLAEEHANKCPHYIRNVHDRGDDSLCDKYKCEVNALPHWIPVAERLPESGVHVLVCCRVKWVGGGGRYYVCDAFYSAPKTEICSYNDDIDAEYDEETDEYYMPEGWWEVIKNWDDYSCVAIADFVTYWMPLTEPPKEGT